METNSMESRQQRLLIYPALLAVCMTAGAFISWEAGLWTLVQMACVVELVYWLARPANHHKELNSDYRAQAR